LPRSRLKAQASSGRLFWKVRVAAMRATRPRLSMRSMFASANTPAPLVSRRASPTPWRMTWAM